jgi:phosphatidylinositol-3-phosphatase
VSSARLCLLLLVASLVACAGCGGSAGDRSPPPAPARALPASPSSHVVVLVMENKERGDVVGAPASRYVNALARRYAIATSSYAITHPSLPNYLALTSGSTQGITSDCTDCHAGGRNIVDQLEAKHLSWKAYMEGLPSPCSNVAGAGRYAKKHDPFMYYDDVARDPRRCRRVVGFGDLAGDLRRGTLPAFAFVSPDLCHDTHDCDVATGDRFLAGLVPRLLRELGPRGFLVLTWDEGSSGAGCCTDAHGGRIATVVAGPGVRRGARSTRPVDHYGVLHTIERALGLPPLGDATRSRSGTLDMLLAQVRSR